MPSEPLKSKPVSRSVYQKVVEENKRIKREIAILVGEKRIPSFEKIKVIASWRKKFKEERDLVS